MRKVRRAACIRLRRWAILRNRIAELRKKRGLSLDELAVYAGVNRTTLATLEREDGYEPHARTMVKLAQYLGVALDELFYLDAREAGVEPAKDEAGARSD